MNARPREKLGALGLIKAGEPEHYQLTHARNAGRRQVKTPLMAVLDADCILPPQMIQWVSNMLGPFNGNFRKAILGAVVHHRDKAGDLGRVAWSGTIISGGWQVFRTQDFDKVGGYNPFITGWGFEDQDFVRRLRLIGCEEILLGPDHGYEHLYHEPEQTAEERAEQEAHNIGVSGSSVFDGKDWRMKY
jgi:GT2 family glycosyltransferase